MAKQTLVWQNVDLTNDLTDDEKAAHELFIEARQAFEAMLELRAGSKLAFSHRSANGTPTLAIAKVKGAPKRQSLADYLKTN